MNVFDQRSALFDTIGNRNILNIHMKSIQHQK
jgi:hypothetical protein